MSLRGGEIASVESGDTGKLSGSPEMLMLIGQLPTSGSSLR